MNLAVLGLVIDKVLNNPAFYEMLRNNYVYVLRFDSGVKSAFGINYNNRASLAQSEAARAHHFNFFAQAVLFYKLLKALNDFERIGGGAARSAAN